MKTSKVLEAIEQLKVHCELKMVNYESLTARSGLYELGYNTEEADTILEQIADGGFSYCLDPHIKMTGANNEYPDQDVCWWGPDQLKSRLECLNW